MPGLVAYNPNGIVENALQFGTIVMAVNGSVNLGSLNWCPGFGICNQYVIITDTYTNGRTSQGNAMPMGFCTTDLSDAALIESINKLAASKSSGPFTNMYDAITWAIIEGYFIINQDYPSIITSGCSLNLDAGLPASYPLVLNEWFDLSGNGNTGILNNNVTYSPSSYGNLEFNSVSDDYITFASTLNIPSGNDNYTISTWFNPSSLGTKGLVGWGAYGSNNEVNALALSGSGIINYWGGNDLFATASLSTGSWYNVVAAFDGTTREIWLNGSSIANDTPVGHNVTYTGNLTVGLTDTSEYFDGKIGEVQIFNRALASNEIVQNYNALLPRYNGSYVDPCNAPPYCTPQSTPTPTKTPIPPTPTQTPTIQLTPTPTPTPQCVTNCYEFIQVLVTSPGDVTFYDCLPIPQPHTITAGVIGYKTITPFNYGCVDVTTLGGDAVYEITFYGAPCCPGPTPTPTPTYTQTPTITPTPDTVLCLGYNATSCLAACSATCVTYYSNCSTLTTGCSLYTDTNGTVAPDGYYSDGVNCYHLTTATPTPTPSHTQTPTPTSPTYSVNVFANVQSIPQNGDTSWKFYYTKAGPTTFQLGGLISSTSCNSLGQISGLKYGDTLYFGGVNNSNTGIGYYYGYTPNISDCADATIYGCNKPFTSNLGTGSTITVTGTTNLYISAEVVTVHPGTPTSFTYCAPLTY